MIHRFTYRLIKELKRTGSVTALSIIAAIGNFAAGVIIARILGPDGRGIVSVIIAIAGIATVAIALGTNVAFRTAWPQRLISIRGYAKLSLLLSGAVIPILALVAFTMSILVDERLIQLNIFLAFLVFGSTALLWLQVKEALNGVGQIRAAASVNALGSWSFLLIVGTIAVAKESSISSTLWAYVAVNVIQIVIGKAIMTVEDIPPTSREKRTLLGLGIPYLGYHFGQELALRLHRPLIGLFSSPTEVGYYAVGSGLSESLRFPALAVGQYILLDTANGSASSSSIAKKVGLWTGLATLPIAVLWILAPYIVGILYGPEFLPAIIVFRLLLVAELLLTPYLIFSRALVGFRARWKASVPGIFGTATLLVLSPILTPRWGASGAAVATILTFIVLSVSSWYLMRKIKTT